MEMATLIAGSELCPKTYRGKPQDCIVAYEFGSALGLSWMQSLRSVSVINGQASLWGDAVPALIYASGECTRFHEYFEGSKGHDDYTAVCIIGRKGFPDEFVRRFSVADAKKAGLWTKLGPWQTYPDRQLQMRARGFTARDSFADKLSGLIIAEEAMDYPVIEGAVVASEVIAAGPAELLSHVPEGLRESIEKAFVELKMSTPQQGGGWMPTGLGLAKLTEFLGGDGVDPEAGAQALLEWCKDEYAKRKTGQPRKRSEGNGKTQAKRERDGGSAASEPAGAATETPDGADAAGPAQSQTAVSGAADRSDAGTNPKPSVVAPKVEEALF